MMDAVLADRKMRVDRPGLEPGTAECKGPDGHQVAALNKRYVGRRSQLASKHAAAGVFFVSWAPDAPSAFPHNRSFGPDWHCADCQRDVGDEGIADDDGDGGEVCRCDDCQRAYGPQGAPRSWMHGGGA